MPKLRPAGAAIKRDSVLRGAAAASRQLHVYGVLSYIVAERTREIGVRMALGAQAGQVRRMVVVQGARVVGAGALIGIGVALASARALRGLIHEVAAFDLPTFAAMSACLVVVGLLASYMPARRASNIDPIESLRADG